MVSHIRTKKFEHKLYSLRGNARGNTNLFYPDQPCAYMTGYLFENYRNPYFMMHYVLLLGAVAKVGVEGSNPFARSSFLLRMSGYPSRPAVLAFAIRVSNPSQVDTVDTVLSENSGGPREGFRRGAFSRFDGHQGASRRFTAERAL